MPLETGYHVLRPDLVDAALGLIPGELGLYVGQFGGEVLVEGRY